MSRDPIGERGGGNLYGFCLNSVIEMMDSFGETATCLKFRFGFDKSFSSTVSPGSPAGDYEVFWDDYIEAMQEMVDRCRAGVEIAKCPCNPDMKAEDFEFDVGGVFGVHDDSAMPPGLAIPRRWRSWTPASQSVERDLYDDILAAGSGWPVILTKYKLSWKDAGGSTSWASGWARDTWSQKGVIIHYDLPTNKYTLPHEFGHIIGWKNSSGGGHSDDAENIMYGPASTKVPKPDCQYCSLILENL